MNEPTFKIHKKLISEAYYVVARWPDGHKTKVCRFSRRSDAERWVQYQARHWLAEQRPPAA
jgi:hypothetical protein